MCRQVSRLFNAFPIRRQLQAPVIPKAKTNKNNDKDKTIVAIIAHEPKNITSTIP